MFYGLLPEIKHDDGDDKTMDGWIDGRIVA